MAKSKIKNLAENGEIKIEFIKAASAEFTRVKTLREQFEDVWRVADYMYKAAQNRSINSSESSKGMNLSDDTRANMGSDMFFRQVNQIASEGLAVELSRDVPFKYNPIIIPDVEYSADRAKSESDQLNVLARYTMKHDKFKKKVVDFWATLTKYGQIPISVTWSLVTKNIKKREPTYEVTGVDEKGNELVEQTGYRESEKEVVVKAFPTIEVLDIASVYADPYIGCIQKQYGVFRLSQVNKADIYNEVRNGIYSEKAYNELGPDDTFDGQSHTEFRQERVENSDLTWEANKNADQYLKWDIYFRAPIDGAKWDEKAVPQWYYAVVVGNEIDTGKVMTIMRNPDPLDEVPFEMINLYPDDPDVLYHVSPAAIVRSNYSAECTLKNLALDNMALVNEPPLMAVEGAHYIKDFTFKRGQLWKVTDQNAVQQFQIRDNTQQTVSMLEYIRQQTQMALGTDKNRLGENFGSRTTATEASNIMSLSSQPSLAWIGYVLNQKLDFYARRLMALWRAFGTPSVINAITDMPLIPNVNPVDFEGEFDVQIDIMDEYRDDMASSNLIMGLVRMVAQAPQLLQSETHQINIGELMKDIFHKSGLNGDKYIITPQGGDSWRMAEMENIAMMENGEAAQIHPDDNDAVHIRSHKAYRLKYNGLEQMFPNVELLDAHIREHEAAEMTQTAQPQAAAGGAGADQPIGIGQEMAGANAGVQ